MISSATKNSPELSRQIDVDELLELRMQKTQKEVRRRRIVLLGNLWERKGLLIRLFLWGGATCAMVAALIPARYASTTRLMPPDPTSGQGVALLASLAGKIGSGSAGLADDLLGLKTSADLFVGVLASRAVQDDVIVKFDLRRVYAERRWVDTRKELASRTDVSIDRKSGILTIRVTDHDPQRARAMAGEYVAQLNNVVTQLNTSSAQKERIFLEGRLVGVKTDLDAAEHDLSQFASKNGAIDIKEQGKAMVQAAATLEGQIVAMQTELQGLRQIYTDNNVRVRSTQARLDELEHQLEKLAAKPDSEVAGKGHDRQLYPSLRKLPLLGVTYADLYRRTQVQETLFEVLTQQYELAKVQEAKEVPSVKILDEPDVPEKKVYPPRLLIVLAGATLGFGCGAAWVIVGGHWNGIDPQDPGKLLVLNMVRSVSPQLEFAGQCRASLFSRMTEFVERFQRTPASPPPKEDHPDCSVENAG
ncbi:MAG: GNVR domain-containing protein [Candidatus Acidiferrum sp.]